jgi:hypothetical protein
MPDDRSTPALVIVNARVWTNDPRRPWADAVLVRATHIVAVGASAELRKRAGPGAAVIDAGGRLVLPERADGRLVAGTAASLAMIARPASENPPEEPSEADIIFSLQDGRVLVDRRDVAT